MFDEAYRRVGSSPEVSRQTWEPEWPRGGGGTGSQPDFHCARRAEIPAGINSLFQKLPAEISHAIFRNPESEHPTLKPANHLAIDVSFHRFLAAATARQVVDDLGIDLEIGSIKIPEQMPQKLKPRRQTGYQRSFFKGILRNAHLLTAIGL